MTEIRWRDKKWVGFCIIAGCYLIAAWLGAEIFLQLKGSLWTRLFVGDVAATFVIWIASFIFQNASIYDPYWSIQPIVILTLLMVKNSRYDMGSMLVYFVIVYWGLRLTANWAYTFQGLDSQDWRYDQLKKSTGKLYQLVNLSGIQLFPTIIVFMCLLPAAYYMEQDSIFNRKILIGILICAAAATLQLVADAQLQAFRKLNSDRTKLIRTGLWKYSRHPNYLGEILMWWGVYFILLFSYADQWFLFIGALSNTLLFLFISIPLSEKRLAGYKEGYEDYKKETRMLLPVPRSIKTAGEDETVKYIFK